MGEILSPDEVRKIRYTATLVAESTEMDTEAGTLVHDLLAALDTIDALRAAEATGANLLAHLNIRHPECNECPGCGESISRTGITQLAYAFETCACPLADYEHLTERIWHLACLNSASPGLAAEEMLSTAAYHLRRFKTGLATAERIEAFLAERGTTL